MITSRDNARVKHWAKLARDGRYRRSEKKALIEGPHLVEAFLAAGFRPIEIIKSGETVSDAVFRSIVDVESPQGIAAEIGIPDGKEDRERDCVFLEGIQDAGNVGTIIRSAAAFGLGTVVLDAQCADPWSPKVLRAGMGGHFALSILGVKTLQDELSRFSGTVLCAVASGGQAIGNADLSGRLAWVFGSEGRGLGTSVLAEADQRITIPIDPGAESLNVAAAAAISFYEASRVRRG
ncbi:MAG: TrmH family RNA methyltransferase [Clostridia bacterium]